MDIQTIGIVALLCVLVVIGIDYFPQKLKTLKINFDLKKVLLQFKNLALAFGDDEIDEIVEIVYEILLDSLIYAEENMELGVVDYDELLFFVKEQVETAGLEIGEVEEEILDIGCDIISSFLYNKYK